MDHPILKDRLNADIVSLLAASNILPLEKRLWLASLPHMTEDEKKQLKGNLEKEVLHEITVMEKMTTKFAGALAKP